jgi:hypothetical protein
VETTLGGLINGGNEAGPFRFEPGDSIILPGEDGLPESARALGRQAAATGEQKPLGHERSIDIPLEHPPERVVPVLVGLVDMDALSCIQAQQVVEAVTPWS